MQPVPGERLSQFSNVWKDFKASPEVVKLLKFGHKIKFETQPRLSLPQASHETKLSSVAMKVIKKEILDLFNKGAMRIVSDDEVNRVLGSKLFVVPKPEKGKFRVIINMKPLNQFIDKKSFKMEGLKDLKYMLKPGCYGAVIDLSDAYYHIKLHEKSRKYTRFIFMGQVMEYTSLPMGLTDSPHIFTRVTKFVQSFLRKQGISMQKRPRTYFFGSCDYVHAPMLLKFFLWLDI